MPSAEHRLQASWVEAGEAPHWRWCRSSASRVGRGDHCRQGCPRLRSQALAAPAFRDFSQHSWGMRWGTWHLGSLSHLEKEGAKTQLSAASRGQRKGSVRAADLCSLCLLPFVGEICAHLLRGGSRQDEQVGADRRALSLSPSGCKSQETRRRVVGGNWEAGVW